MDCHARRAEICSTRNRPFSCWNRQILEEDLSESPYYSNPCLRRSHGEYSRSTNFARSKLGRAINVITPHFASMPIGLTRFGIYDVAEKIVSAVQGFLEMWIDRVIIVDIFKEKWMPILLEGDTRLKCSQVNSLQRGTISSVTGFPYISIVDAVDWFHRNATGRQSSVRPIANALINTFRSPAQWPIYHYNDQRYDWRTTQPRRLLIFSCINPKRL